jgi:hypothetical protein
MEIFSESAETNLFLETGLDDIGQVARLKIVTFTIEEIRHEVWSELAENGDHFVDRCLNLQGIIIAVDTIFLWQKGNFQHEVLVLGPRLTHDRKRTGIFLQVREDSCDREVWRSKETRVDFVPLDVLLQLDRWLEVLRYQHCPFFSFFITNSNAIEKIAIFSSNILRPGKISASDVVHLFIYPMKCTTGRHHDFY